MNSQLVWHVETSLGTPLRSGMVRLSPSGPLRRSEGDHTVTVLPDPVYGHVVNGVMTQEVAATDDPRYSPEGWAWRVDLVGSAHMEPFYIYAPEGQTVDVGKARPVPTPDGTYVTEGRDGVDGRDGADGHTPVIEWAGTALSIDGTVGPDLKGQDGVDGRDGVDGTNGADGRDGVDGADGSDGRDGTNGTNGRDGVDGTNGRGIVSAEYGESQLAFSMSDGTVESVTLEFPAPTSAVSGGAGLSFLEGLAPVAPKTLLSGGEYSTTTAAEGQLGRTSRQWFKPVEPVTYARFLYQNLSTVRNVVNNPITVSASVERNSTVSAATPAPVAVRVTFNGSPSVVLAPGSWALSDPIMVDDVQRSGFYVRTFTGVSEVGQTWPSNGHTRGALYPGEMAWYGDRTGSAEITGGFAGTALAHGPAAILTMPTDRPVVTVVGDSITQGSNDGGAGEGYWTRYGNAQRVRVNKAAANGESARWVLDTTNNRDTLWLQVVGSDYVVCALGTNDSSQWQNLTGMQEHFPRVWDRMNASAREGVYQTTLPPNTTSTDSWATTANQMVRNFEAVRTGFNAWLRSGAPITGRGVIGDPSHPLKGVLDVAPAVEDAGKWRPGFTNDGVHPTPAGHEALATRLVDIAPAEFYPAA